MNAETQYSEILKSFLLSRGLTFRFIEFDEPVKTVEQAAKKVDADQIAKSIVLIDSNNQPLLVVLLAKKRVSYRKLKTLLGVKDVRLASEQEVLEYSGYPVGGVPPFNQIKRVLLDSAVQSKTTVIAGGGDINKLVELRTKDLIDILQPVVAELTRSAND